MKLFAPIAAILVCTSAMLAYATPVLIEFTVAISRMSEVSDGEWTAIQSRQVPGYNVSAGETMKDISHDTDTALPVAESPWEPTV